MGGTPTRVSDMIAAYLKTKEFNSWRQKRKWIKAVREKYAAAAGSTDVVPVAVPVTLLLPSPSISVMDHMPTAEEYITLCGRTISSGLSPLGTP